MMTMSPAVVAAASLAVAFVLLAIFYVVTKQKASKGNALLLVGPPDAGKTAILSTLLYGETMQTHTSLQSNSSVVSLSSPSKIVRVVDIPGHPRVRDQYLEHIADAKVLAFVVDASTISRNGAAVAEHLHHILHNLTSLPPSQTPPSLLILAHKTDLLKLTLTSSAANSDALAISRVKTVLERELEKRKASQLGGVGVEGLGAEGERSEMGGLECNGDARAEFKFEEWDGGEVYFLGTHVKVGKRAQMDDEKSDDGLSGLRAWLEDTW